MEASGQTDQSSPLNGSVGKGGWESFLPDRPLRVLLVEDDHATMQVVCALMCKSGYEVTPATNGLKAWELLERSDKQFDLVLADAMMPIFSGTDLLAKMMKSEAHRDIPVIMMSSHDSLDVVFKCLLRGAKDFLVKPLRKNELRNLWQHVWRKNHELRRRRSSSGAKETRRKRTIGSGSEDLCSYSKDYSENSDQNTRSGSDNGSATQSLRATPVRVEEDSDIFHERDPAVQQKHLQHPPGMEDSQRQEKFLPECQDMDQQCSEDNVDGKLLLQTNDTLSNTEGSEASERFAKAIDLIGTMTEEFRPRKEWNCEGEESALNASPSSPTRFHRLPALELTLKRPSSNEDAWCDADARKAVKQSDCSAFSRYTSGGLVHQQQSISTGASLPSDQCSFAGGLSGISAPSGDRVGTANTAPTYAKLNQRIAGNGSCGSSTLHFPQAISFQQGRQCGDSTLSLLTCRGDYDGRETVQEKNMSSLTSPTTASNSHLPNETLPYGNSHTGRYPVPQHPCGADSKGPLWSFRQAEMVERDVCNHFDDNLEHKHHDHRLHRTESLSGSEVAGVASNQVQRTFFQNKLVSMPSDMEIVATETKPTACKMAANIHGSSDARGSGSNSGSGEGSNFYDVHQNGGSSATAQDGCSLREFVETDENSAMRYSGLTSTHDGGMVQPDNCRITLREAALNKFRQKRKIRCFEKKVRYQSRKKLAEQRPRVKGQFVRQAVYDALGTFNKVDQNMVK